MLSINHSVTSNIYKVLLNQKFLEAAPVSRLHKGPIWAVHG